MSRQKTRKKRHNIYLWDCGCDQPWTQVLPLIEPVPCPSTLPTCLLLARDFTTIKGIPTMPKRKKPWPPKRPSLVQNPRWLFPGWRKHERRQERYATMLNRAALDHIQSNRQPRVKLPFSCLRNVLNIGRPLPRANKSRLARTSGKTKGDQDGTITSTHDSPSEAGEKAVVHVLCPPRP